MNLLVFSQGKHYCWQRPNIALCRQFKTRRSVKNYIVRIFLYGMRDKEWEKLYLCTCTRHNVCCVLIETHCVDFNQPQTRLYEQRNKTSWETISIAENVKECQRINSAIPEHEEK